MLLSKLQNGTFTLWRDSTTDFRKYSYLDPDRSTTLTSQWEAFIGWTTGYMSLVPSAVVVTITLIPVVRLQIFRDACGRDVSRWSSRCQPECGSRRMLNNFMKQYRQSTIQFQYGDLRNFQLEVLSRCVSNKWGIATYDNVETGCRPELWYHIEVIFKMSAR